MALNLRVANLLDVNRLILKRRAESYLNAENVSDRLTLDERQTSSLVFAGSPSRPFRKKKR